MNKQWIKLAAVAVLSFGFSIGAASAQSGASFNGPYVGLNAGGGLLNDSGAFACTNSGTGVLTGCPLNGAISGKINGSGFIGGVQGGYNVPVPMWGVPMVIGGELDFQGTTISGSTTTTLPVGAGAQGSTPFTQAQTFTASELIKWMSSFRARLGYAGIDRLLIYGTAGVAFGQVNELVNTTYQTTGVAYTANKGDVKAGPIVGGGVEWAFMPNLSAKVEGLYYDLGNDTLLGTRNDGLVDNFLLGKEFRTRGAIFRLGLNWQFGVPPAPPPPMAPTPVAAPAVRPAPAPAPASRMFIVFFDFDKATLTPDGQKVVDAAAAAFKAGGSPQLQVSGYTDLSGTAAYNLKLSQRRADAVDAALVKDGVPKSAISSHALGKSNPRVPTADGVREPQNRRVEIVFPG